jgi:hypothetical protein
LSSLEESKSSVLMNIYPNPVKEVCTLDFELEASQTLQIILVDANGRLMQVVQANTAFSAGQHQLPLNLSSLPPGDYFLQMKSKNWQKIRALQKI